MPQFDFYLFNKSFEYRENTTLDNLRQRIEIMADDCDMMRTHGDRIFRNSSIYEVAIYEDKQITDVIWPNTEILSRDQRNALQRIIDRSHETTLENDEIVELLDSHDKETINGILTLNRIDEISNEFLVYDQNDWFTFHRYFLWIYPISERFFHEECKKYFPKVYLHNRVRDSLSTFDGGFFSFVKITIKCLAALNDDLSNHISNDVPTALKSFSVACGIETTNEGNAKRKADFTFSFPKSRDEKQSESVCCEPHMKLSKSDNLSDNYFYHNRLYFHFPKEGVCNNKVLVGHIGKHL